MKCMTECFLSAAFMGGSILMMFTDKKDAKYNELYNSLSEEKKKAFKKIKKERMLIWIKASLLGVFASISFTKFQKYIFDINSAFNKSCINTLIFYAVQHLVYSIHPKSDWMLNHVENNKQAKAWLAKYKTMQNKWHMGMILGLVGYYLLSITIFKNRTPKMV